MCIRFHLNLFWKGSVVSFFSLKGRVRQIRHTGDGWDTNQTTLTSHLLLPGMAETQTRQHGCLTSRPKRDEKRIEVGGDGWSCGNEMFVRVPMGLRNISSSNLQGRSSGAIANSWAFVYFPAVFLFSWLNGLKRFISFSNFRSFFLDPCQIRCCLSCFLIKWFETFIFQFPFFIIRSLSDLWRVRLFRSVDHSLHTKLDLIKEPVSFVADGSAVKKYSRNGHIWIIWALAMNVTCKQRCDFLHNTPAFDDALS